jgi:hypothetical protein
MAVRADWTRRGSLGAADFSGGWAAGLREGFSAGRRASTREQLPNMCEAWEGTIVINGQGTMTMLGGSLISSEVEAAKAAADMPKRSPRAMLRGHTLVRTLLP